MREPMRVAPIELGDRSYEVVIGAGALALLHGRAQLVVPGRRALVVADAGLPDRVVTLAEDALRSAGFGLATRRLAPSEEDKSLETVRSLLEDAARARLDRHDVVLGLGGGIVGDVAGFVAASYRRGVHVIQAPTTLLAMVDASVGGKTGVNLRVGERLLKNMVGAFWQPRMVLADVATLESLPPRHLRCGLAECLKHGLIARTALGDAGADLFGWTAEVGPGIASGDLTHATELVARHVEVKAAVVRADEREEDAGRVSRAILNLGHTFAHVLEGLGDVSPDGDAASAPLAHGEAVALGLVAATAMSGAMGEMAGAEIAEVRGAVGSVGLPVSVEGLPRAEDLAERMRDDKKVVGGTLRVIAPRGIGRAAVVVDPPESAVLEGWRAIGAG
jgi:3-dehydroquinate synthetase